MTPKQYVKKKYPKAYSHQWGGQGPRWVIYTGVTGVIVHSLCLSAQTAALAWKTAAANVKKGKYWS